MNSQRYLEKVYAGFLGMNMGIRLGAPVESGWTYERIRDTYGDIRGYVKNYKKFAADDDANGPVFFLRALYDDAADRRVTPQDVARAWLNYAREGVGMFWWGGYGISTEHTAYLNLKNGIPAPQSGSIAQNGQIMAEQIGGQIFIDTWGLIHPGDPKQAAEDAAAAASVSHDGEGLNGARFIAGCIAAAFTCDTIGEVLEQGKAQLPEKCLYRDVLAAVEDFHRQHPEDWRACRMMLEENWGYDKYTGVCHIIPNAGVCMLSMLYGGGDFARTIEIATMCSWDTDCNAGNVGTVLGVLNGIAGLPEHYRRPINDSLILSGVSGYLNILDIPSYAKELAVIGLSRMGEPVPENWKIPAGEIYFDFDIPGATHGFEISDDYHCMMRHSTKQAHSGTGSLEILMDKLVKRDYCQIYYKPFYSRDAFSDERYMPVLTPQVYSGQTVSMELYLDQCAGWDTPSVAMYYRTAFDKKQHFGGYQKLTQGQWQHFSFVIPDTQGALIDEIGISLTSNTPAKSKTSGAVYLDDFRISGPAHYSISFARQRKELGTVTPFAVDHGYWEIAGGKLASMREKDAFAYGGSYYGTDVAVKTEVTPLNGSSHLLLIRAQGTQRFYAAGLDKDGLVIYKNDFGFTELARCPFRWELGQGYCLTLQAAGDTIRLLVDGQQMLQAEDSSFRYGMYGCGSLSMGRTLFGDFAVDAQ